MVHVSGQGLGHLSSLYYHYLLGIRSYIALAKLLFPLNHPYLIIFSQFRLVFGFWFLVFDAYFEDAILNVHMPCVGVSR